MDGRCFDIALKKPTFELLQILCAKCPPNEASIESVLFVAIDPRYCKPEALELLLSSSRYAAAALNTLRDPEKLRGLPSTIIPCLLRHGWDATFGDGALLPFAIEEKHVELLDTILSANPSIKWLKKAFYTAGHIQPRTYQLDTMKLLLKAANSAEIGQSKWLLTETYIAYSGDCAGAYLLLSHKAVATPDTFAKGCLYVASSTLAWDEKERIFELLYAASPVLSIEDMSNLLTENATRGSIYPGHTQLRQFLLANGAIVTFEALKFTLHICCESWREMLTLLINYTHNTETVVRTFRYSWGAPVGSERKYWIYQQLLDKGIPSDDVSEALLESLKIDDLGDLSFPKLLLENGASPVYQNGEAFDLALRAKSPDSLVTARFLLQYIINDSMATAAFKGGCRTPSLKQHGREQIYRPLLEWNIDKIAISEALVESYKHGGPICPFCINCLEGAQTRTKTMVIALV